MKTKASLTGLLLLLCADTSLAQVYRCEKDGKLAFSDQPCTAGAKASSKTYASPSGPSAGPAAGKGGDVPITYFAVQGATYETLAQSLAAAGAKGFHGKNGWWIDYDFTTRKTGDSCQIDTVRANMTGEMPMPRWTDERTAPLDLQQRWTKFYAAHKLHEDAHLQHSKDLIAPIKQRLLALGPHPCDQTKGLVAAEFKRLTATLKTRDDEYDVRTQSGGTQGANF
jgi:predicted secreted Zn-dependent protease